MKESIFEDQCPFSVSDNNRVDAASYVMHFDGAITRHGCISGFKATDLKLPFHVFLMNTGERDIRWDMKINGKKQILHMGSGQIFFNPANQSFSRYTADCYEFFLLLLSPEKLQSITQTASDILNFDPVYNIWDPQLELPLKVLLSEVQSGNLNGEKYVNHIISLIVLHLVNNYTSDQTEHLVQHIQGFTKEVIPGTNI